jgi:ADP-ribosylglycohydrolase
MPSRSSFVARSTLASLVCVALALCVARGAPPPRIAVADYEDKVRASFLGQLAGNFYGLGYEFKFIDQPGPDAMPYGFRPEILARLREVNGAFSDDDTDIEYMYLLAMERHGIEPTYAQLAAAWKHHVRERVWVANRAALTLMRAGHFPPHTGRRGYNGHWFQIDPQLVNELWAVTAPGMIRYATAKSDWAARITSDSFGVEPTVFYAAMYSAAFFERDINKLVDAGLAAMPPGSRFAEAVRYTQELVQRHPHDWRAARAALAARYHGQFDYNAGAWPVVDAVLNGSCGIMALLYGHGDFQRTLDLCCALGFDADNQAATMCGLLGIVHGTKGLPPALLAPLPDANWTLPYNDRYVNVSRHALPDASIADLARRFARQGERVILTHGGQRIAADGIDYLEIPANAAFTPPFEFNAPPPFFATVGEPFAYEFYTGRDARAVTWRLEGELPRGLVFANGTISGTPQIAGTATVRVHVVAGAHHASVPLEICVRGENLATSATEILFNPDALDRDLALLRDGERRQRTYFSVAAHSQPKIDFYGYRWTTPQRIAALRFSVGEMKEWGGWFTSLVVQAQNADGTWREVSDLKISPTPDFENSQWLKASHCDYDLRFAPVETTAIRLIGSAGGIEPDEANRALGLHFFTAISELAVYGQ